MKSLRFNTPNPASAIQSNYQTSNLCFQFFSFIFSISFCFYFYMEGGGGGGERETTSFSCECNHFDYIHLILAYVLDCWHTKLYPQSLLNNLVDSIHLIISICSSIKAYIHLWKQFFRYWILRNEYCVVVEVCPRGSKILFQVSVRNGQKLVSQQDFL